ncbi:uncharacterized protein LOC122260149 isoform X2 [Penaeus japonicus]|uniref:uncharacterized protein LOC122260149 isoform X2 n=1 Tax=Penaeus japonicus TaxID=27405 RepID=UPI001C710592|nr:uncharacterized protein LOC122260149 isoform X2 [Penaeus japonicus]
MMKTVAVLLTIVGIATALDCFVCNSYEDHACADEFQVNSTALQNAFIKTCEEKEKSPFCRKMRMYIYKDEEIRISRDCGYERRDDRECYQKRSDDYIVDVCQCDDDLCNGSPSLSLAPLLALALPFFVRFL